jgi:polysaccharide export outer membrane protein
MLVGCVTRTATIPEAESVQASSYAPLAEGPYRLDSGDRLRVVVFGQDGLTTSYAVDSAGSITMPLIGPVRARGLTTSELAASIAARLRQGYIREPHVAVEVEAHRPFFILGEVAHPGQYPYVAHMTVETAVAIAGGFTPRARKSEVELTRPMGAEIARGQVPLFYPVQPGDTINVAERWF